MRDILVVMARKPAVGAVKSRLARVVGEAVACDLYRAFLRDLRARLGAGPWRLVWAVHPAGSDLADDVGAEVECIDQRGEDLAARMRNCFADLLEDGAVGARVVMIGADVPHLASDAVEAAFAGLERSDVVLRPTRDGGYCLIGMRRALDLFSGIPVGTAEVYRRTVAVAGSLNLRVEVMAETFDVDEASDLEGLAEMIRRGEVRLPFTEAVLKRL